MSLGLRKLLYVLVWCDIRVRDQQAGLGAAWVFIQPIFPQLVFTLFFANRLSQSFTNLEGRVPTPLLGRGERVFRQVVRSESGPA